jgi:hypothetical protein
VARKKRKKKSKGWFGFGSPPGRKRKKTKRQIKESRTRTVRALKRLGVVFGVLVILGGVGAGFVYLDRYVHSEPTGDLELVSPPPWVEHQLHTKIRKAVGEYFYDSEGNAAETVASRLEHVVWLYNVKVQETRDSVQISASYRKPVAMVKSGSKKYYLSLVKSDDKLHEEGATKVVVLDDEDVAISNLPIVEVKGFSSKVPAAGSVWQAEDITTTVELLSILAWMDGKYYNDNPLLEQLESIDVSNFEGKRKKEPHVMMYATDGTPIHWGAAYGKSTLYLEALEDEKLGTLYSEYKKNNYSLQFLTDNVYKSVDLRIPKLKYPRPGE